ncbi:cell division protein FtsI [Marmoricola endophyticus]|uniref:Beta-lactamase n=1 Tax=Marmoricola endophyticus TaxID=2040280 RepID=A0A917BIX7_9ACTN|nr:penicillin-binding transpeptidase domain-containing protein [Marmoricola endophyticus]GGF46814.1 cell division protein FtsI [Marmoricola endophyticus]
MRVLPVVPRRAAAPLALVAALVSGPALGGCSLGGSDAEPAAKTLAAALSERDVSDVRFSGATGTEVQPELEKVVGGMQQVPAKVTVGDVDADGDRATASLTWSWDTGGKPWTTRSSLDLRKSGEDWLPVWSPSLVHADLAKGDRLEATTLLAQRGDITGARDAPIVTLRLVDRVGIDKSRVSGSEAVASARRLAQVVGVDAASYASRVKGAGAKSFVEAITFRRNDGPSRSAVEAVPGARVVAARAPLAPTKSFAAPILGKVGSPTKEIVDESDGKIRATDQVGIGGLQQRYDDALRGRRGVEVSLVKADGSTTTLHRSEPVSGQDLRTTLDLNAQELAEKALARTTSPSALVAIRPSDGSIVAAASGPASKGQNTATYSRYAPGSTFKVVTSLALLRAGLTPESDVTCAPSTSVDGKVFTNYSDYPSSAVGTIPLREAIANSCNTAVISEHAKIDHEDLADAAAALGVGVDHDLGFPAYFGQVPDPSSDVEAAADMIGQGKVLASPMAMAAVAASVVEGKRVVPHLVTVPGNSSPAMPESDTKPAKPLTAKEADELRGLMRGVVTYGSGKGLADLPDGPAIAKTGTAEYGETTPLKTHAWMIAGHGDLAVAVFVGDGASGSGTAGPILERFLRGYR